MEIWGNFGNILNLGELWEICLGEPSGRIWGNRWGRRTERRLYKLSKNPLKLRLVRNKLKKMILLATDPRRSISSIVVKHPPPPAGLRSAAPCAQDVRTTWAVRARRARDYFWIIRFCPEPDFRYTKIFWVLKSLL